MNIPHVLTGIGFNRRVLTFEDFENICTELGVKVFFTNEASEGLFFHRRGHPIIVLNKNLSGFMLLFIAWHELAHYLLHPPMLRYFAKGTIKKIEAEANDIALCCVIPLPALKKILALGTSEDWLYPKEFMSRRCELYTRSGN